MQRLAMAVLCTLLTSGVILGTIPSCGRSVTASAPTCCRNEASCPMHQKNASGALGLDICRGDGAVKPAVRMTHRAVLAAEVSIAGAPHRDHVFATKTILLASVSTVPWTPPPRMA